MTTQNPFRFSNTLYPPIAVEGKVERASSNGGVVTRGKGKSLVKKVQTVTPTVTTQAVSSYSLLETVTQQIVTVDSDATPTAAEVVSLFQDAISENPILNGLVTVSGTSTLILTANIGGLQGSFNFVDNNSDQALTVVDTTAAADSVIIPPGRGVIYVPGMGNSIKLIDTALGTGVILDGFKVFSEYEEYSSMDDEVESILRNGEIWLYSLTAMNRTSPIHIYHTGDNAGRIRASADAPDTSPLVATAGTINGSISALTEVSTEGLVKVAVNLP